MWDASNTPTIIITGGVADVLTVIDGTGNGNDLQKVGSSNHPQYHLSGLGPSSKPYILLTATDLCALECSPFPMGTGNELTWWYVGTNVSPTSQGFARPFSYAVPPSHDDFNDVGTWSCNNKIAPVDASIWNWTRNNQNIQATGLGVFPDVHIWIGTINSVGLMTLYVDGVSAGTNTQAGNWITGGAVGVGRNGFGNFNYATIRFGELTISTTFSNATLVGQINTALKSKWGL